MRFFLIHGTGGGPQECWYPWIKEILEGKGHEVVIPQFPTPFNQTLQSWMKVFEPHFKDFNSDTVLIGRSIGVPFALRLLESSPCKVRAAFLVAGFYEDLGLPQFEAVVNSFIEAPFNWEKIKGNCEKFLVYNSDNDPIVPLENGEKLARKLQVKLTVVRGGEHIWFDEFPEILPDVEKL